MLAIEKCLLEKLPQLMKPETICKLTREEAELIAAESEISLAERKRLNDKLAVLQRGLTQLEKFKRDFSGAAERGLDALSRQMLAQYLAIGVIEPQ